MQRVAENVQVVAGALAQLPYVGTAFTLVKEIVGMYQKHVMLRLQCRQVSRSCSHVTVMLFVDTACRIAGSQFSA